MNNIEIETNFALAITVICTYCGEELDVNILIDHQKQEVQINTAHICKEINYE